LPPLAAIKAEKERRLRDRQRIDVDRHAGEIRARCLSLMGFMREAWRVLEPETRFVDSWHLHAVAEHLEAVTFGRIMPRLLVNVPPGASKSLLVSVLWQAWEWGPCNRPSLRYLATSYNDKPVTRDTRKCRDLILSQWYQALWPHVRLVRAGETSFANDATGTREGLPFGSLTSQRGDRLLIDDPHSTETAVSAAEREATTRKFREGALNRLNDQDKSAIVIIMQRLHEQDLSGVVLAQRMGYVHLSLPMRFEIERRCETPIFSDPRTYDGELLAPERFSPEACDRLEKDMGAYAWAGQYQQRPAPREGGLFKRRWFEIVRAAPAIARRVRRWDLAGTNATGRNDPDWTVGVLEARTDFGTVFVEDVVRLRDTPGEVERAIVATAAQDRARYGDEVAIGVPEDPGQAGKAQSGYLIGRLAGHYARAIRETGDKQTRALPFAAQCEAGNVRLIAGAWNEAFLAELETFPSGAHDDQVDAAAGAFNMLIEMGAATSTLLFA
jgi:predicted phage terminase large subunit-like protein